MAKPIITVVEGVKYPSFKAACDAYNICAATALHRIKRGWSLELAVTSPTGNNYNPQKLKVDGVEYRSLRAACKAVGVPYKTTKKRGYKQGASLQWYLDKYREQEGKCEVCLEELELGGRGTCVDHCHDSGKARGILCQSCNRHMAAIDSPLVVDLLAYKDKYSWGVA